LLQSPIDRRRPWVLLIPSHVTLKIHLSGRKYHQLLPKKLLKSNNVFKSRFSGAFPMRCSNTVKSILSAVVLGFLALGLASTSANAQTDPATTTFGVSTTVLKDCIVSATAMGFGNYSGALAQITSTITVTCTNTTTYDIGLNAGTTSGGQVTARLLAGQGTAAGQTLAYSLTSVSYAGTNWGNSSPTWVAGTGNGVAQPYTVYGQIAAGLYVTPGTYTDTITVTVTY
jgi:spore coat protein U-like protein